MIPRVPKVGRSFLGAWKYYAHDKRSAEQKASREDVFSKERVAWTHSENLFGFDANRAAIALMSDTSQLNKRCKKPVYTVSLAWHPEQSPTKEQMIEAGRAALKVLGMEEHQALFLAHKDTDHSHVHIMVNRIHPQTLKAKNNYRDFKRLSDWARAYEKEHGKIYCTTREANAVALEQDTAKENAHRYADNAIAQAWNASDSGRGFKAAIEARGWKFGLGDRKDRFMVLAPNGKPLDILRELNKLRNKSEKLRHSDIEKRFADIKREELNRIAELQKEQEAQREEQKRRDAFKRQGDLEASRAFHKAADDERRAIERLYRELKLQHIEQQKIFSEQANKLRQEARQAIEETYRLPDQAKELRALQSLKNEKATLWGKLSGNYKKQQEALSREIRDKRRMIAESEKRAAQFEKHTEDLIQKDRDDMARRQSLEEAALPPRLPDPQKEKQQEPQRQQMGRERSLDPPNFER